MQCIKTRTEWLKRIISVLTGRCVFGDAVPFISKNCKKKLQLRVLFGDIFLMILITIIIVIVVIIIIRYH